MLAVLDGVFYLRFCPVPFFYEVVHNEIVEPVKDLRVFKKLDMPAF